MRQQRLLGFPVLLTLALVLVDHVSRAQMTNPPADPAPTDVALPAANQPSTPGETLMRMDASRSTVRRMLEQARSQRDVIKTLCLDDKLNQIDVAIRNAREHKANIDSAVKKNDLDSATRENTRLNVLRERTDQLVADANICIGKEVEKGGETLGPTSITMTIDPSIPDEPVYFPPGIVIIPPPSSVVK